MLRAEDAYRLSLVCKSVRVCFRAVVARSKCKMPRELAVARLSVRQWNAKRAAALLEDAASTPYKTKPNMIRQLFRHVLTKDQLYDLGYSVHNPLAMRLALAMKG